MTAWLAAVEASDFARILRDSVWLYPLVNLAHVIGIALLFGAIFVLDLRLMGWRRSVPLPALAQATIPVAVVGLAVAILSGATLFTVKATEYAANPMLYAKFGAIALGGMNMMLLHRSLAWRLAADPENATPGTSSRLRAAGFASLLAWLAAIAAGRWIAYW